MGNATHPLRYPPSVMTHSDGPTIRGARVLLRPVAAHDLPFLQALWNDGAVMQYVGFPNGLGMTAAKIARWWRDCQGWTATHLIIESLNGTLLGESGWGFAATPGLLELKLARAHWGQGYASDALAALLDYLFGRTALDRALVTPHQDNAAARRLYHKLGFRPDKSPAGFDWPGYDYWTLSRSTPAPAPSALVFDWGGVLMRTEDPGGRREWERRLQLPAGGADRAVFESRAWREAQLGRLGVEPCWAAIGQALGLVDQDLARFRHDFWAGDRLNEELFQRIRQWKAAGRHVTLLSNYTPELEQLLDRHGVRHLFKPVILSAHEGIMKPASRLFWRALNRMDIPPAGALFVDDFAENIAGAQSVGMHSVHFRSSEQTVTDIERLLA